MIQRVSVELIATVFIGLRILYRQRRRGLFRETKVPVRNLAEVGGSLMCEGGWDTTVYVWCIDIRGKNMLLHSQSMLTSILEPRLS